MENENDPLLAAVSAGIDQASGATPTETPDEQEIETVDGESADTGADAAGDTGADAAADAGAADADADGAAAGDEAADGDVDENDPAAVKAAEDAGRTRDPKTGKFTKAEAKVEPTAEEKAIADKAAADKLAADAAAAAKKPADAINDPIPKELNRKTQERMRTLIETVKKADEKVTKADADRDFVIQRIVDTGATPEQYNSLLGTLKLVNSTDPNDQRKALAYLQSSVAELSRQLGVVVPGVDVLGEHADLKQRVELGQISRKDAEEMAALRNQQGHQTRTREQQAAAERAQGERTTAVNTAKQGLTALGETLEAADPSYKAKSAILIPMMQETFKDAPPAQWASIFQKAYNALVLPAAARPAPRAVVTGAAPANQPMRARTGAGGQVRAPSSIEEAISAGIAAASGR